MWIEVINKKIDKTIEEISENGKKLFTLVWYNLVPEDYFIISEYIYINLDINLKFKKKSSNGKVIIIGECNDKFWFFKIIKKANKKALQFSAKKPLYSIISSIKIIIVDWYDNLKSLKINDTEIEYAIGKII